MIHDHAVYFDSESSEPLLSIVQNLQDELEDMENGIPKWKDDCEYCEKMACKESCGDCKKLNRKLQARISELEQEQVASMKKKDLDKKVNRKLKARISELEQELVVFKGKEDLGKTVIEPSKKRIKNE